MGAAVPFALARRRGTPRRVGRHIVRRALILFALGLVLNAIETPPPLHWATFRIPGVLQRIAIVYLAVAWLTEHGSLRAQIATVGRGAGRLLGGADADPGARHRRRRADADRQSRVVHRPRAARPPPAERR